jgi:antibiotic biosynthesis monooxygenase (ABM) superfamily enzyme
MEMMEASRQYQDLLEAHRVDPDDEATWDELQKAKTTLEVVWLEVQMN